MEKLKWSTVQRTPNELQAQTINPRKISDEKRAKLIASLKKFGDFSIITVDFDNSIISGHQRCTAMQAIGNGEVLIDVRIPNRLLSEKEKKEIMLIANEHSGEYDFDLLAEHFTEIDFDGLGLGELKLDLLSFGGESTNNSDVDFSSKNKELSFDDFKDARMFIKLDYSEEEYHQVRDGLSKIGQTPEQAIWILLEKYNDNE